jgi:hypothetical protein
MQIQLKLFVCFKLIWLTLNITAFLVVFTNYHDSLEYFYLNQIVQVWFERMMQASSQVNSFDLTQRPALVYQERQQYV